MSHMRSLWFFMLVAASLTACKKDELDVTALNTNPFDVDYQGPAIFTFVSATTTFFTVNGVPTRRLNVTMRVNVDLFPRDTPFQVRVSPQPSGNEIILQGTTSTAGAMTFSLNGVEVGQQYCPLLQLGNAGGYGGGNTICATAE